MALIEWLGDALHDHYRPEHETPVGLRGAQRRVARCAGWRGANVHSSPLRNGARMLRTLLARTARPLLVEVERAPRRPCPAWRSRPSRGRVPCRRGRCCPPSATGSPWRVSGIIRRAWKATYSALLFSKSRSSAEATAGRGSMAIQLVARRDPCGPFVRVRVRVDDRRCEDGCSEPGRAGRGARRITRSPRHSAISAARAWNSSSTISQPEDARRAGPRARSHTGTPAGAWRPRRRSARRSGRTAGVPHRQPLQGLRRLGWRRAGVHRLAVEPLVSGRRRAVRARGHGCTPGRSGPGRRRWS